MPPIGFPAAQVAISAPAAGHGVSVEPLSARQVVSEVSVVDIPIGKHVPLFFTHAHRRHRLAVVQDVAVARVRNKRLRVVHLNTGERAAV